MQDLGFRTQSQVDFSQLLLLVLFLAVLAGISLYLRKQAQSKQNKLTHTKGECGDVFHHAARCDIQALDKSTYLYSIEKGKTRYVVFKSEQGAVLLDKIESSDAGAENE